MLAVPMAPGAPTLPGARDEEAEDSAVLPGVRRDWMQRQVEWADELGRTEWVRSLRAELLRA